MASMSLLAHMYIGFVQISTNRASQGIAECRRALELDRNLAMAHGYIGLATPEICQHAFDIGNAL
jgi:hypothetical protein